MRIVSLLPSATEILVAIGAGPELVGVTHECDFPAAVRALPHLTRSLLPEELQQGVGAAEIDRHVRARVHAGSSLYALDAERLEALAPDLIVTQELCAVCAVSYEIVARAAKRLRGDPRIISLEPSSLDDVYATIATLGELTHHEAGAQTVLAGLRAREAVLRAAPVHTPRPQTLVLEWTDPPMSGGHWTPGLVELAGGEPILANPGANSQTIAWEAIVAARPDVVIVAPCGFDLERSREAAAALPWDTLPQARIYVIDGNAYVNRPGPRLLDTAEQFAQAIANVSGPLLLRSAAPTP